MNVGAQPDVTRAEAAGKATVRPGVIQVVVKISSARIVADPGAIGLNMRNIRMPGLVSKVATLWSGR